MNTNISQLTAADFDGIDALMKRHSRTLGFLPQAVICDHLDKGSVLGARSGDGRLAGYLLYASYSDRFRIVHLCVADEYTKQGIARKLIDRLKHIATTQKVIRLRCRRDYPAHAVWPRLGFVPFGSKPGRSSAGHHLELWQLTLAPSDQLDLFYIDTPDEDHLSVVIDANVFFDFDELDDDDTKPSKILLADFLVDHIALSITDEIFVEIDRKEDQRKRNASKQKAHIFHKIYYNQTLMKQFENILTDLLPTANPRQISDIRQIAKTAASDADTFVTRDNALLKKSREIFERTKVNVMSPSDLIIRLRELSERQTFTSTRVSGLDLEWRAIVSDDFEDLRANSSLYNPERKGRFIEILNSFLLYPDRYTCELLQSRNEIVAIRILEICFNKTIIIHMGRVTSSPSQSMFVRFLIADIISKAIEQKASMVEFSKKHLAINMIPDLIEMGFVEHENSFLRFCLSEYIDREKALCKIAKLYPESSVKYRNMSNLQLERWCSPLGLEGTEQDYFLIPIRPSYAMDLFDRNQSTADFFGGKIKILLRWENVYYRRKTHHKMLNPPARILWYVSGQGHQQIVAVSHLDSVEVGSPKTLYRKYRRFGTLDWQDIYQMCNRDLAVDLMALKFSNTFLFREPLSLETNKNHLPATGDKSGLAISIENTARSIPEIVQSGISGSVMNMKHLLLSLKPHYADLVFDGLKKAELRRHIVSCIENRYVFIYVSSPSRRLRGGFRVGEVWCGSPEEIWSQVSEFAGIGKQDFDTYYAGRTIAYALSIMDVWEYKNPMDLNALRDRFPGFVVPQSWRYVRPEEYRSFRIMKHREKPISPSDTSMFGHRQAG